MIVPLGRTRMRLGKLLLVAIIFSSIVLLVCSFFRKSTTTLDCVRIASFCSTKLVDLNSSMRIERRRFVESNSATRRAFEEARSLAFAAICLASPASLFNLEVSTMWCGRANNSSASPPIKTYPQIDSQNSLCLRADQISPTTPTKTSINPVMSSQSQPERDEIKSHIHNMIQVQLGYFTFNSRRIPNFSIRFRSVARVMPSILAAWTWLLFVSFNA